MACSEEINYWKRYHVTDFILSKDKGTLERNPNPPPLYHPAPDLLNKIATAAQKTNIERYRALLRKIKEDDKEYDAEDIHWLKIMCQEIIPQINKHFVVKMQIDGTGSEKHALGFMKISNEAAKQMWSDDYEKLSIKLSKMDTIPGEGIKEPRAFRIESDGTFGSNKIEK